MTTYKYQWVARDWEDVIVREGTVDATSPEDAERRVFEMYESDYFWGQMGQTVEVWEA